MLSAKEKYRKICLTDMSIPLFSKDWWLDAVCGENAWDVSIVENNGEIIASLPYCLKQKLGFKYIFNPQLTPRLGLWIKYPEGISYPSKLGFEKKIIFQLIDNLPKVHFFNQKIDTNLTNWLPFYWQGFKETTKYTYIIKEQYEEKNVKEIFSRTANKNIKKASRIVKINDEGLDLSVFYKLINNKYKNQKLNNPLSFSLIKNIINACEKNKCCKLLYSIDEDNNIHSAILMVWDNQSLYFIVEGNNAKYRKSSSKYLIHSEAINFAVRNKLNVDFGGSMIQPIEHLIKQFGAQQVPYFHLSKINSKFLKIILSFIGKI